MTIGIYMNMSLIEQLTQFLVEYRDIITWSHEDMPEIDLEVMEHSLHVELATKKASRNKETLTLKSMWQ